MHLRPTHLAAALFLVPALAASAQTPSTDELSPTNSNLSGLFQGDAGTSGVQLTTISEDAVPNLANIDAAVFTGPPSSPQTPEPSSFVLLATGLAGATAAYRRRRRS